MVKGYKVFNPDWTCREKQYEVGKIYHEERVILCERGMHFCKRLVDCFNYYSFNPHNKVAEVIAHGNVIEKNDKCCTDILEIVREITWEEVLRLCNTGDGNIGNGNTGNNNTGNYNTGNSNSGRRNSGCHNIGVGNTGNNNTGNYNTGDRNTGNYNTGNDNTGNWNTGDYNVGCNVSGCFCTENQKIKLFNKPSNWDLNDWFNSDAKAILFTMPVKEYTKWIYTENMSPEEKKENPSYKATGGYLKVCTSSKSVQEWWDGLVAQCKEIVMALPNFDADIFEQCTGIKVK